jgi:release factor-specific protein-(glutamine-N5) methyltransferase
MRRFTQEQRTQIRWLLQEKYSYSPSQILDFFNNPNIVYRSISNEMRERTNHPKTSRLHSKNKPCDHSVGAKLKKKPKERNISALIKQDIKRILSGEPIAYIIGSIKFLNCLIDLSQKPLIPRPETEYWLEKVIQIFSKNKKISILDLCCGSGCLGIACLKLLPQSQVDFVDISPKAIEQTKINLHFNQISLNRFHLIQSDLFSSIPKTKYDLILANPPYVNPTKPSRKELKFEPTTALFANDSGLSIIKRILFESQKHLKPNGSIYLEFGAGQKSKIESYCRKNNLSPKFFHDQFNRFRYLCLTH